jgi:dUTP pyrophosphatase
MRLRVKKLVPEAKMPTRAREADAGLDLYSMESCVIAPMERLTVRTGIAMEIPIGYAGLVWDKSGLAAKAGIKTMGGVIDAGYRGEIQVILANLGHETHAVAVGEKIAQMLIQKVELLPVEEVSDLSDSERGDGGFGSTGV